MLLGWVPDMIIDPNQRPDSWLGTRISLGWLLLAIVGLSVTAVGWWLRIRPAQPVWGPVAEWVSGLGQVGALVFLAWQILLLRADQAERSRQEKAAKDAEREARAKAVVVAVLRPDSRRLVCDITNAGAFPVHGVTQTVARVTDGCITWRGEKKLAGTGGVLFPGSGKSRTEFDFLEPTSEPGHCLVIEYCDAWCYQCTRAVDFDNAEIQLGTAGKV